MRSLLNSLFLSLVLFSLGCSHSSNSAAPGAPSEGEGGINGGGGGTLPANPISTFDVMQVIQESKKTLNPLMKHEMKYYSTEGHSVTFPYEKKIFGGPVTIWDELQNTDIEILMDKPCRDLYGNPVDGSVHASKPNAICISAFRIAPKLIKERAAIEINALILHELSHRLGTTEPEAKQFQENEAFAMSDYPGAISSDQFARAVQSSSEKASGLLSTLKATLAKGDATDQEILDQMQAVQMALGEFYGNSTQTPYSIFNKAEHDYYWWQADRFMVALWCQLTKAEQGEYWQGVLNEVFQGAGTVTELELQRRHFGETTFDSVYADQTVSLIHDRQELKDLVDGFEQTFGVIEQAVRNLWLGSQMGPMPTLKSTNSWEVFKGEYQVTSRNCTGSRGGTSVTGYRIDQDANDPSQLEIVDLTPGGYFNDGGLYDGAFLSSGQTAVHVEGSGDRAVRIAENGDRWGQRFDQISLEIENSGNGFVLTQSFLDRQATADGWTDQTSSCSMTLKRLK